MVEQLCDKMRAPYEIFLFNDGSTDATGTIAESMARQNERIHITHHEFPRGLGYCYKQGVAMAKMSHVMLITANNECKAESIAQILEAIGKADIISPFIQDMSERPWVRRILSRVYVGILNAITGLHLKYYNGTVLHNTSIIRSIEMNTDSYAYQAEALIKLLAAGHTCLEVGIDVDYKHHGSKALRMKNVRNVLASLVNIILWIYRHGRLSPHQADVKLER